MDLNQLRSQQILCRVEQNDAALSALQIGGNNIRGIASRQSPESIFTSSVSDDYSRLGSAIGENRHLTTLAVHLHDNNALSVEDRGFYDGLKRNSSIKEVTLRGNYDSIIGGVLHEVLKVYQENNSHLTFLNIHNCNLDDGGDAVVSTTLRRCTNLKDIEVVGCSITDEQLLPLVEGIRGHHMIEELNLARNRISAAGCQALDILLGDPNSNIRKLNLMVNQINVDGAITVFNSLSTNSHLQVLYLKLNPADRSDVFPRISNVLKSLLCNTASINDTYASNHTLEIVGLQQSTAKIVDLLKLNKDTNKNRVATKKILGFHPNIDMEPLFGWDAEEDEQNLKALPYVISWFDRANAAVADDDDESYNVEEKKLSAILQFAKAMPLLFVPASHIKKEDDNKKRKRDDNNM